MTLKAYKKNIKKPLLPRTLTFLMKDKRVLLGLKKRGFGKGYLLGIGGKVEQGETIEAAAKREIFEEISVHVEYVKKAGIVSFYFPHIPDESWNQTVHIFTAQEWQGEPQESEEIKPEWFDTDAIPYEKMWNDAKYWLPQIQKNKLITGEFLFNDELRVSDYILEFS